MISIIIPSYNEERFLPQLLESLAHQKTRNIFEVIIVDGDSKDDTLKNAKKFSKHLDLRIVTAKKRGAAEQRNEGIEAAQGEWILFIDADNKLPPNFIEKFTQATLANTFDIAIFKAEIQRTWPLHYKIVFSIIDVMYLVWRYVGVSVQHGGCIAIRTSAIHHRFETDVNVLEDFIFVHKNARAGGRYRYLRDPQFLMSLRRFKRDGLARTLTHYTAHLLSYAFFNKKFLQKVHYTMDGGTNYKTVE